MLIRYTKNDIIEEVKEGVLDPLISNLIPLKKGANKIRLVLDLRPQNFSSRKTKSSHTSLFETLYSVDLNATHFSTIDLSSSYCSIKLHPSCYRYFCFFNGFEVWVTILTSTIAGAAAPKPKKMSKPYPTRGTWGGIEKIPTIRNALIQ